VRLALRLVLVAGLAALVLPDRAAASAQTVIVETSAITVTAFAASSNQLFCSLHPARMTQLVIVR
jgi:hypothetical protein